MNERDQETVELTAHAIRRYHERVRPSLTVRQAESELLAVLDHASISPSAPPWYGHPTPPGVEKIIAEAWVQIGEDIALPCRRGRDVLLAMTCLTRSSFSDGQRTYHNNARKRQRKMHKIKGEALHERRENNKAKRRGDARYGEGEWGPEDRTAAEEARAA